MPATMSPGAQMPVHHSIALFAAAAVVLLIVIVGVAYLLLSHPSQQSSGSSTLPSGSQGQQGQTAPGPISQTLSNGNVSAQQLTELGLQYVASQPQFHVNYTGNIKASGTGLASVLSYSIPISVKWSKYNSNTRLDINLTNVPFIKSFYLAAINDSEGSFGCTNLNLTSNNSTNNTALVSGVQCFASNSSVSGGANSTLNVTGLSASQRASIKMHVTKQAQSTFNGMACTFISGNMTGYANSATGSQANATTLSTFSMCISNQYYIPLTLNASIMPQSSNGSSSFQASIALQESSIGNSASDAYITTLPGPIVNTTANSSV